MKEELGAAMLRLTWDSLAKAISVGNQFLACNSWEQKRQANLSCKVFPKELFHLGTLLQMISLCHAAVMSWALHNG